MRYETPSGIVVTDRRHSRADAFDDPRGWTPNANTDPPPPDGPGTGPNQSEGYGNTHVMYADASAQVMTASMAPPQAQAWSGWPVEWNMPTWGSGVGLPDAVSRVSTVFGCIDLNASILSTMPPYLLSGEDVVGSLPWMLNPQPEVYSGWVDAMKQIVASFYCGEAFLWCTSRYANGSVRNFVMLDPNWVQVKLMGQIRRYYLNDVDISEDVLHLRYLSWPGRARGMGPLEALASNLFGVAAMEKYQANLAMRGGIPWGVLTAPGNLTKEQAGSLRQSFVEARMSSMGAPATLSGGVTLTPFSMSPSDMALLELRQFDEARIATLLGVPPLLMGLPEGGSMVYKNVESIYDFHWRAYLRPKAAQIMEAISQWALPSTQCVELNRDEYVRPNFGDRVTAYATLFSLVDPVTGERGMTICEIRKAERLAAFDDEDDTPPSSLDITLGQVTPPPPSAPAPAPTPTGSEYS